MKIYIAHSRSFDFQKELYEPIKNSLLIKEHVFIFPHDNSDEPFSHKDLFQNDCDLIIAEVSYPATGLGIELGWADIFNVPIICFYRNGFEISDSLKAVTNKFLAYSGTESLITKIAQAIKP